MFYEWVWYEYDNAEVFLNILLGFLRNNLWQLRLDEMCIEKDVMFLLL